MINETDLIKMGQAAKKVTQLLRSLSRKEKDQALFAMADALRKGTADILSVNQEECQQALDNGKGEAFIERMTLTPDRIEAMANGLEQVAQLPDPINHVDEMWINKDGLQIGKRRVPLGVIGIIYESRPNVTSDAAGLCFKTGNAVILRGGKETIQSNQAIINALQAGLKAVELPEECIQFIDNPSHDLANQFMQLHSYVDCLIPRGSNRLIQNVVQNATIPTIETGVGNCHLYVHQSADLEVACKLLVNGKTQRISVCNALESLVVDKAIADQFLPMAEKALNAVHPVTIHGDDRCCEILPHALLATEDDFAKEYLDYEISVKVVDDFQEAVSHIETYSTHHSDVIATQDYQVANDFLNAIDSACVYVNASSRFTDGEVFGFGGEIGISTQKLHARGPMGLEALTSYKYIIYGQGQIRSSSLIKRHLSS